MLREEEEEEEEEARPTYTYQGGGERKLFPFPPPPLDLQKAPSSSSHILSLFLGWVGNEMEASRDLRYGSARKWSSSPFPCWGGDISAERDPNQKKGEGAAFAPPAYKRCRKGKEADMGEGV